MKISKNKFLQWIDLNPNNPCLPPNKLWSDWDKMVNNVFEIQRQPEFFAQCAYESNHFKRLDENLNYTTVDRIRAVFGRNPEIRNKTNAEVEMLLHNPKALAAVVYHDHPHLGNDSGGAKDLYKKGWKTWDFRGQGFIQLTGYNNWKSFKEDTKIDCFKDKKYFQKHPWAASGYYWVLHDLDYALDMKEMTKIINGGYNGLQARIDILKTVYSIMKT